jgi:hypothetical protein
MYKLIDCLITEEQVNEDLKGSAIATALAGTLLLSPIMVSAQKPHTHARHQQMTMRHYTDAEIVNAIVGEASNQGYDGMLAVACAIRNRIHDEYYKNNVLYDVYGKNASHVKSEPHEVFDAARRAWSDSKYNDVTNGAIIWGNDSDVARFRNYKWFQNVKQTTRIGDHTFFKRKA